MTAIVGPLFYIKRNEKDTKFRDLENHKKTSKKLETHNKEASKTSRTASQAQPSITETNACH